MNTVLFDLLYAQPLNGTRFHGGGEYIKSVFQALAEQYDGQYTLEVCFDPEAFLDQWDFRHHWREKNPRTLSKIRSRKSARSSSLIERKIPCAFLQG